MRVTPTMLLLLPLLTVALRARGEPGDIPPPAPFALQFKDFVSHFPVFSVFVLPGQMLEFEAVDGGGWDHELHLPSGGTRPAGPGGWKWRTPGSPGLYRLEVRRRGGPGTVALNVFVMVPIGRMSKGYLNGYRIGDYPSRPLKGLDIYRSPAGFVEVTPSNEKTFLSPHFRLEQFLCKQAGGYPKYVVLQEKLLLKLESVLEEVHRRGIRVDTLSVMSGYRTPFYNRTLGNVAYSRHLWGGAADVFIDRDGDGVMDDLNGDGRFDLADARWLYELIDGLAARRWHEKLLGGLAPYRKTAAHGPFVHLDVRGFRARWGIRSR